MKPPKKSTPTLNSSFTKKDYQFLDPSDIRLCDISEPFKDEDFQNGSVKQLADFMMLMCRGEINREDNRRMVGLAAPQIGVLKRLIVIDLADDPRNNPPNLIAIANPRVTPVGKIKNDFIEGCFSTSRICGVVSRYLSVTISGLDLKGAAIEVALKDKPPTNISARIAQHEVNHLDGIRFPDRAKDVIHLHWVPLEDFPRYRTEWPTWPNRVSSKQWQDLKNSRHPKLLKV